MIFLSHNWNDKPVVEQIAVKLAETYGQENVFYDSWSMQPGDGIIDKMNEGLQKCKVFLFFVSKNSLESNMVKMEWQNAIMKKANNNSMKFIPIKLDDSFMPTIMTQNLYINLYSNGLEIAIRQIIDVINENNNFQNSFKEFSNVKAYLYVDSNKHYIEVHAEHYMEPINSFLFLKPTDRKDIFFNCNEMCLVGGFLNRKIGDLHCDGVTIAIQHALVPNFPMKIEIEFDQNKKLLIGGVMHEKEQGNFKMIPLTFGKK